NRIYSFRYKPFVCLRKMFATEETCVRREGRGVHRAKDEMLVAVDERAFLLREFSPEEKDHVFLLIGNLFDDCVGEFCPANSRMIHRFRSTNGERSIEEEDSLFCPTGKIAMIGNVHANIVSKFFEDVDQRRRRRYTIGHGE